MAQPACLTGLRGTVVVQNLFEDEDVEANVDVGGVRIRIRVMIRIDWHQQQEERWMGS